MEFQWNRTHPWVHPYFVLLKDQYHPCLYHNHLYCQLTQPKLVKLLLERDNFIRAIERGFIYFELTDSERYWVFYLRDCCLFELHRRKYRVVLTDILKVKLRRENRTETLTYSERKFSSHWKVWTWLQTSDFEAADYPESQVEALTYLELLSDHCDESQLFQLSDSIMGDKLPEFDVEQNSNEDTDEMDQTLTVEQVEVPTAEPVEENEEEQANAKKKSPMFDPESVKNAIASALSTQALPQPSAEESCDSRSWDQITRAIDLMNINIGNDPPFNTDLTEPPSNMITIYVKPDTFYLSRPPINPNISKKSNVTKKNRNYRKKYARQWSTNATQRNPNATQRNPNATQINTNVTQINTNVTQINTNVTQINTNATQINTNATERGTNATQNKGKMYLTPGVYEVPRTSINPNIKTTPIEIKPRPGEQGTSKGNSSKRPSERKARYCEAGPSTSKATYYSSDSESESSWEIPAPMEQPVLEERFTLNDLCDSDADSNFEEDTPSLEEGLTPVSDDSPVCDSDGISQPKIEPDCMIVPLTETSDEKLDDHEEEKLDDQEKADDEEKLDDKGKPGYEKKSDDKEQPGDKIKPGEEQPGDEEKSDDKEQQGDEKKPGDEKKTGDEKKSGDKEESGDEKKPGDEEQPGEKEKPGDKEQSGDKKKPGDEEKSDDKEQPGDQGKPDYKEQPGDAEKPGGKKKPDDKKNG